MKSFVFVIAFVAVVRATSYPQTGYNYPIPEVIDNYRARNQNSLNRNINIFTSTDGNQNNNDFVHNTNTLDNNVNTDYDSQITHQDQTSSGVTIQKHIYVHVAPPEAEEFRQAQQFPVEEAQKHYKIIFIKAPSFATPAAPVIPQPPQNEEKTLVYVLVKKPEEQAEIIIPTAAPTQPSKPEVYFIRYKSQKDHSSTTSTSTHNTGTSTGYAGITDGKTGEVSSVYGPPGLTQH